MTTHGKHQILQTLGANLKEAREAQGLTQKDVGDRLGVTNRDVSRWESGAVEPSAKYRYPLADLLFDGDVSALYRDDSKAAA